MNRATLSRTACLALAATLVTAGALSSTAYAQASHEAQRFTEDFETVVPASDSCSGEDVHVYGTVEATVQTTVTGAGEVHVTMQFTPHLTAVGLTTGLTYRATGPAHLTSYDAGVPSVFSARNIIRLVARGSADNLIGSETTHIVIDANGETRVFFDEVSFVCRG